MTEETVGVSERLAYLEIINKLIQLINPEKFVELERLQVDKSLAMIQQLESYKRQNMQLEMEQAKAARDMIIDGKTQERMLEMITEERQKKFEEGAKEV